MRIDLILSVALFAAGMAHASDGQELFVAQKCTTCHAVSSVGLEARMTKGPMAGPDLVGVADSRDAAWITAYLRGEEKIEGKKHARPFKGTPEELQTIVSWVLAQPAP